MNYANFFELKGKTITSIQGINSDDSDTIITTSDGTIFTLLHQQDCCEHVRVYGTVGNIDDVINVEVIDRMVYAMGDGEKALDQALGLIK